MANNLSDDELFEKMRSGHTKDTVESDDEDKLIKTIKQQGYDYYKILGVSVNTSLSDIKRKYRHKIAEYHPDKLKQYSQSKIKEKQEQFKLIRMAGEVLTNPEKKKLYDLERKTIKSKDFYNQKSSFDEFLKLQESEMTEEKKKHAELEFKHGNDKFDRIRGYNPDDKVKYDRDTTKQLLTDLQTRREMESIELAQKNLFEGRSFNPSEFNKFFDKQRKLEDKKLKIKQERGELVNYSDGFTAFNDTGVGNFISVNDDYDDIYGKDNFKASTGFSRVKTGLSDDELSISSVSSGDEDDYYNTHNQKKIGDDEILKYKMQREKDSDVYDKMKFGEFKSVMEDQFGISKDFGTLIGDSEHKLNKITSDTANIYKRLIELESGDEDN
jgi:curved DNA-binding protein CbpA